MDTALIVAHPHSPDPSVALPWAVLLTLVGCLVAALVVRVRFAGPRATPDVRVDPLKADGTGALWWTSRGAATVAFVLVLLSGRDAGAALVPVLLVVVGLPTVLIVNVVTAGHTWPRIDPFDTLARIVVAISGSSDSSPARVAEDPEDGARPINVRPAVVTAAAWTIYLVAYHDPFDPTILDRTIVGYTVALLIGCLVVGRASWIQQAEVVGVLLRWSGRIRRSRLASWEPPRGAAAVCGVLAGGFVFESLHTAVLAEHPLTTPGRWLLLTSVVATVGLVGYATEWTEHHARRLAAEGSVVAGVVPVLAAATISQMLAGNLLLNGSLLAFELFESSFGVNQTLGWDRTAFDPLGPFALLALRSAILLIGAIVGMHAARRHAGSRRATLPAVITVELLLAALLFGAAIG